MLSHAIQGISGLSVITVSEIITGCPQSRLFLISGSLLLPACLLPEVSKALAESAITLSFCPFLHDLLIRRLNLLELFFRLSLVGIIDIGIGMIFSAQDLICFFDFFLGSISAHSQDTIRIISHFLLPRLHCLFPVFPVRSHSGTILRNTEYSAEYPHSVK